MNFYPICKVQTLRLGRDRHTIRNYIEFYHYLLFNNFQVVLLLSEDFFFSMSVYVVDAKAGLIDGIISSYLTALICFHDR